MSSGGARAFFNVEHTSVKIALEDEHKKEELHLSPVILSEWHEFFAARYKPGAEWIQTPLLVENVQVAKELLRAGYVGIEVIAEEWANNDGEWLFTALKQCDMWQSHSSISICILGILRGRITGHDSAILHLQGLANLRETSIGNLLAFSLLLYHSFDYIDLDVAAVVLAY